MHKTKRALIDTVLKLMDGNPAAQVTIHDVLAEAEMTSGSLYYHFTDFQDLVGHALVDMYAEFSEEVSARLMVSMEISGSAAEYSQLLDPVITGRHSPKVASRRAARAWIAAQAALTPSLAEKLAPEQQRGTQKIADAVAEAQRRALAQPDLDPYVVAVFIQAYSLGRIVDDIAGAPMNGDNWTNFIKHMVKSSLLKVDDPLNASI